MGWCSHTGEYNGAWGYCKSKSQMPACYTTPTECVAGTNGQTPKKCAFPFVYKGKTYTACTQDDSAGLGAWCSHDKEYSGLWGRCPSSTVNPTCYLQKAADQSLCTSVSPSNGKPSAACAFPFVYKGQTYTTCTDVDGGGKSWCSHTGEY